MSVVGAPGVGDVTLGSPVSGFLSFNSALNDGDSCPYVIEDPYNNNWEIGIGVYYVSGTRLVRNTVLASSAGGTSKISATSSAIAMLSPSAADFILAGNQTNFTGTSPQFSFGLNGGNLGSIQFYGSTSGSVTIQANAVAGTATTLTLPATSDTFVGKATTDTLTNKTFDTAATGNVFKINGTQLTAVTGTGSAVLATNPTLTTPTLGVASATSVNKITISAPATGATLTIADGKTLTASNTLTFAGTDGTTITFPSTNATMAGLSGSNVWTASNSFTGSTSSIYLGANGGNLGIATFYGSTSGSVTLKAAAAAGTSTVFQLPSSNGTLGYALQTDGSGATSWAAVVSPSTTSNISIGYTVSPYSIGTISSGTITFNSANGNYQYYTNNGAHTLNAPSSDCAIDILITNSGTGGGTITMSGFTAPTGGGGDTYATTASNKYILMIRRINSVATYMFKALQ